MRLLAPYFGASTIVWANTIGVVLVALSVGYWLGGRLADRHPNMRGLCLLALTAGGLLALVPFAADPLLGVAVDALDEISAGAFVGSLLAVLVLVAVPVLLLGAVSPYAIRLAVSTVEEAGHRGRPPVRDLDGRLAGRDAGVGAAVDPAGRHAPHVPGLRAGDRASSPSGACGRVRRYALAPAAIAALIALPVGTLKADAGYGQVIYETETQYQYARVVEERRRQRARSSSTRARPALALPRRVRRRPAGPRDPARC